MNINLTDGEIVVLFRALTSYKRTTENQANDAVKRSSTPIEDCDKIDSLHTWAKIIECLDHEKESINPVLEKIEEILKRLGIKIDH
jgi:hypothetical protein